MFRRGEGFGSWLTLMAVLVVALVLFGCDSSGDESGSSVTEPLESTGAAEPQPMGTAAEDEAMAADVQRYFARNAHTAPWFTDIESISVAAGVVTVETTLNVEEPSGRVAASQICSLIQGRTLRISLLGTRFAATGNARLSAPIGPNDEIHHPSCRSRDRGG